MSNRIDWFLEKMGITSEEFATKYHHKVDAIDSARTKPENHEEIFLMYVEMVLRGEYERRQGNKSEKL